MDALATPKVAPLADAAAKSKRTAVERRDAAQAPSDTAQLESVEALP
jgi:hypothetical protein